MAELFIESEYHSIPHQFAEFRVANVDYIIDFSSDNDVIESLFIFRWTLRTAIKKS